VARPHRGLVASLAAGVVVIFSAVAIVVFFVSPATSDPVRSGAIVVLAGDPGDRIARALSLMNEGWSGTLVLDGKPGSASTERLCQEHQSFEVVCLRPSPDNTRDEARAAARLAADRGWRTILVVTSLQHVTRARLLFDRCFKGDLLMVGSRPPYSLTRRSKAIGHEVLGTAWALVHPGC
jgi:uncharacterized SAM-binding protein YcdF (DUF218 family)